MTLSRTADIDDLASSLDGGLADGYDVSRFTRGRLEGILVKEQGDPLAEAQVTCWAAKGDAGGTQVAIQPPYRPLNMLLWWRAPRVRRGFKRIEADVRAALEASP